MRYFAHCFSWKCSQTGGSSGSILEYEVIYPGGSSTSPGIAKLTSGGQRFVSNNPFPGYLVHCVAEVYAEGEWGETGWAAEAGSSWNHGQGVKASQLNNDKIVTIVGGGISTSGLYLLTSARRSGMPHTFAFTGNYGSDTTKNFKEVPFRVKVYKLAKIK